MPILLVGVTFVRFGGGNHVVNNYRGDFHTGRLMMRESEKCRKSEYNWRSRTKLYSRDMPKHTLLLTETPEHIHFVTLRSKINVCQAVPFCSN